VIDAGGIEAIGGAFVEKYERWSRPSAPFVGAPRTRSVTWVEPRLEAEDLDE
jgi:hypothetical protein